MQSKEQKDESNSSVDSKSRSDTELSGQSVTGEQQRTSTKWQDYNTGRTNSRIDENHAQIGDYHTTIEIYPVTEGNQSSHTKQAYKNSFNRFLRHIRIFDLQVLIDQGPDVLKQMIIKYVIFLRDERRLSRATIEAECAAIFHFFDMNDIDLKRKRIKIFLPPDESTHDDRLYTQEEKQRILAECDKRQKVVVLLMNSAGLRIGAIHVLKISDLEFIPKHNIYKITVYGRSKNARHWTLCNFECYNAIQDYLEQRERQGEGTIKGSSPLIREQCDPVDYIRIRSPRPMSYWNIRYLMNDVLKRSGVKTPEVMMSHSFRKNFETVCEESGMKALHSEMLVGHSIKIRKAYLRPKTSDIIEDYMTHAADALTIDPKQRLQKENQELKSERDGELARLKSQMRKYQILLDNSNLIVTGLKEDMGDIQTKMAKAITKIMKQTETTERKKS